MKLAVTAASVKRKIVCLAANVVATRSDAGFHVDVQSALSTVFSKGSDTAGLTFGGAAFGTALTGSLASGVAEAEINNTFALSVIANLANFVFLRVRAGGKVARNCLEKLLLGSSRKFGRAFILAFLITGFIAAEEPAGTLESVFTELVFGALLANHVTSRSAAVFRIITVAGRSADVGQVGNSVSGLQGTTSGDGLVVVIAGKDVQAGVAAVTLLVRVNAVVAGYVVASFVPHARSIRNTEYLR